MARSIQEMYEKFKRILGDDAFFYGVMIILVAVCSFGLGRLSVEDKSPEKGIEASVVLKESPILPKSDQKTGDFAESITTEATTSTYVASKNGTKYHALWCPGASQIKEENKVYFASKEEAEASGYTPASNCKGI